MNEPAHPFPADLRVREHELIEKRRAEAKLQGPAKSAPIAALALSGGGIRSATFNLGVLQALARAKLLKRFDYLSTVSGGGYIGSFLGAWINRAGIAAVEDGLAGTDGRNPGSLPVRYLRENGRYLTPNGKTDAWLAACQQVRSQFTILLLLLLPVLGTILWAEGLKSLLRVLPESLQAGSPVQSIFWPAVGAFALVTLLPLASGYWFVGAAKGTRKNDGWMVSILCLLWLGAFAWAASRLGAFFGAWTDFAPETYTLDGLRNWTRSVVEHSWRGGFLAATLAVLSTAMVFALNRAANVETADVKATRRKYTDRLAVFAALAVAFAVFALVDTLAQWFAREVQTLTRAAAGPLTLAAVVAIAQRLGPWLAGLGEGSRLKLPTQALAWIAAIVVAAGIVVGFAATVHLAAINRLAPLVGGGHLKPAFALFLLGGFAWALAWVCGNDFRFVNLSSMHRLYSSRLSRAYVGASNPKRTGQEAQEFDATQVVDGDDVPLADYAPNAKGGPLHLINVTVNETVSGQSNVDKEDRRGLGMAVGPVALSVGPRANLPVDESIAPEARKNEVRRTADSLRALTLGEWVGVSGAAFTTGMGANTSLPLSFLLGLFNVRLGFWWNSDDAFLRPGEPAVYPGKIRGRRMIADYTRANFPAQDALVDEITAQFHGPTRRHWYLSDGGHFENTACYELVRRQVPLIVCCDCGADPDCVFEDVANLVRKARIDFGAEIEFLDSESAGKFSPALGSLDDLRPRTAENDPNGAAVSTRHGAVAKVTHFDGTTSVLLVIKPTLSADAPIDLLQYDAKDRAFPQQTTLDQFFDEAQWESYRKLGVFIGEKLFRDVPEPGLTLWSQLVEYARTGALPRAATPTPAPAAPAVVGAKPK